VHCVLSLPLLSAYLVGRSQAVDLVDLDTSTIRHTFETESMQPRTLKYAYSARRQAQLGPTGLGYFALAYTSADSGDCVIQTYVSPQEGVMIGFDGLSGPVSKSQCSWNEAREIKSSIPDPGVWEALPNGCIVGVRKKSARREEPVAPGSEATSNSLRNRSFRPIPAQSRPPDTWEVWSMCQLGKEGHWETKQLDEFERHHLLVSQLGPMVKVGSGSVAIGFGNVIKVITIGQEQFGSALDILEADSIMNVGSRRRRPATLSRIRAHSRS